MLNQQGQQKLVNMLNDTLHTCIFSVVTLK